MGSVPYNNKWLQHFLTCSPEEISQLVSMEIPQDRLPIQYLEKKFQSRTGLSAFELL